MSKNEKSATAYDFLQPGHKINTQWPIFDLINARVASEFGSALSSQLQVTMEGHASQSTRSKYSQCVSDIGQTGVVYELSLAPLPRTVLFCMDTSIVSAIVDCYFGGSAVPAAEENARELSRTELRVMQHIINALLGALGRGWSMLLELDAKLLQPISVDRLANAALEQVMLTSHMVLRVGEIDLRCELIYPFETLKPLHEQLQSEKNATPEVDEVFTQAMQRELMNCELDIHGVLAESRITLGTLLELKPGDFIPLRDVETVSFKTQNMPLFDARIGNSNGRVSASVSRWHLPAGT
ncbi:MAG: FliM/FliN family flagellar motor switch protein [Granulosicoccus sp.]|nr:FliM/FliN family flagellar motor switch protein [Granulosicoccus sp.]